MNDQLPPSTARRVTRAAAPLLLTSVLLLTGCGAPAATPGDTGTGGETPVAAPTPECTEQMGVTVTGGAPEEIDFTSMGLPAELAPALNPGMPPWTCAYRVDYVTGEDTHLVDYELYYVSYDGTTPAADLKAAFDADLVPQGFVFSVAGFQASEDQMNPESGELDPDVDPLTLKAYTLAWQLSVPNAVYPAQTSSTVQVEFGGGSNFGLPDGPDFGQEFRGSVTRVGYLLRVPYASYNP